MTRLRSSLRDAVSPESPLFSPIGLAATALAVVLAVFLRALLIQAPIVFSDEANYAMHIAWFRDPLFEAQIPNILYFLLYSWTPGFGINFHAAAKALNAVFIGAAFLAIYATARGFMGRAPAYAIALVAALSPISSSAAYVMPDSLYFATFWALAWCLLVGVPRDFVRGAAACGAATAALWAIKPHGLVVGAAVVVAIAVGAWVRRERPARIAAALVALLVAFVVARFAVTLAATGGLSFPWFGKFYSSSLAGASSFEAASIFRPVFWYCLAGHLMLLAFLFLPASTLAFRPGLEKRGDLPAGSVASLVVFTLFVLGLLVGMVVKFSADTTGIAPTETASRLHGRLYEFALPLILVVLLARQPRGSAQAAPGRGAAIFLAVASAILSVAAIAFARDFKPIFLDFPTAIWILEGRANLYLAIAGLAIVSGAFLLRGQRAAVMACCAVLVAMMAWGNFQVVRNQSRFSASIGETDRELAALARLVPAASRNDGAIVARALSPIAFRASFHALSRTPIVVANKESLSEGDLPPGRKWLLLADPYQLEFPYVSAIGTAAGFRLVQIENLGLRVSDGLGAPNAPRRLVFASGGDIQAEGFHAAESWGAWTRGTAATVWLGGPVSGLVRVRLVAHAFAGNAGRALTIALGDEKREFRLGPTPTTVEWDFDLKKPAERIEISGMAPVSPTSVGAGADDRLLGVGVATITVQPRSAVPARAGAG